MSFAITYTVKNEAHWILDAIAVHRSAGCERFYVFLDGTSDATGDLLSSQKDVVVLRTTAPEPALALPDWLTEIVPRFAGTMDVRKRYNTWLATRMAQDDKIDWLVSIDVDEILDFGTIQGGLERYLAALSEEVDQVLVPNVELLPCNKGAPSPFAANQYFLRRLPATEFVARGVRGLQTRLGISPRIRAWTETLLFRGRLLGVAPRILTDPTTGKKIPCGYFLGYRSHKSIIRVSRAERCSFDVHQWVGQRARIRSVRAGRLLHFDLPSEEAFLNKFRQRSASNHVAAFHVRYQLAKIATECPDNVARRFYREQIQMDDRELDRWVAKGIAFRI